MGKRGPRCSICANDKHRVAIELGIVHGISAPVLAQRFSCSKHAITRHKAHLSPAQRAALLSATKPTTIDLAALQVTESEGLLHAVAAQRARLHNLAETAAGFGDIKGAVAAENSIQGNLALVAKLLGQLTTRIDVRHSSVLLTPDYLKLRSVLVQALKPYPQAAQAVSRALFALESDAAKVIEQTAKPPLVIEHQAAPAPPTVPLPPLPAPPC
jgi:hypothetical protein